MPTSLENTFRTEFSLQWLLTTTLFLAGNRDSRSRCRLPLVELTRMAAILALLQKLSMEALEAWPWWWIGNCTHSQLSCYRFPALSRCSRFKPRCDTSRPTVVASVWSALSFARRRSCSDASNGKPARQPALALLRIRLPLLTATHLRTSAPVPTSQFSPD